MLQKCAMTPAQARPNRIAVLFLLATLAVIGLEVWGIRASLADLFIPR